VQLQPRNCCTLPRLPHLLHPRDYHELASFSLDPSANPHCIDTASEHAPVPPRASRSLRTTPQVTAHLKRGDYPETPGRDSFPPSTAPLIGPSRLQQRRPRNKRQQSLSNHCRSILCTWRRSREATNTELGRCALNHGCASDLSVSYVSTFALCNLATDLSCVLGFWLCTRTSTSCGTC
jgi:hypothetical protein